MIKVMLNGYSVYVMWIDGGVGCSKRCDQILFTSMIKEVMVVCLIGWDRKSEKDGRDSISLFKYSLLSDYMMTIGIQDVLILNSDSPVLIKF